MNENYSFHRTVDAYNRQKIDEGLIWDGVKYVYRKIRDFFTDEHKDYSKETENKDNKSSANKNIEQHNQIPVNNRKRIEKLSEREVERYSSENGKSNGIFSRTYRNLNLRWFGLRIGEEYTALVGGEEDSLGIGQNKEFRFREVIDFGGAVELADMIVSDFDDGIFWGMIDKDDTKGSYTPQLEKCLMSVCTSELDFDKSKIPHKRNIRIRYIPKNASFKDEKEFSEAITKMLEK